MENQGNLEKYLNIEMNDIDNNFIELGEDLSNCLIAMKKFLTLIFIKVIKFVHSAIFIILSISKKE